ncbi:hypothetical protein FOIG_16808 [Fusarium odoratissimum NRRL 54006]|uniref:Uncharacterized protein n=1 Tax=Fusarium odoratissimum (strain NRRL 54006) TaxID=1089451 RepID=X0JYH5_FUSO5|nr:uncharacterized protein FOIG_16808 [Fusarium odoratissimum NRRL 54006]EXL89909.1 hypothetical protein FOIG_16808 [Fusarium odoratissimum NRRL 54006]
MNVTYTYAAVWKSSFRTVTIHQNQTHLRDRAATHTRLFKDSYLFLIVKPI